MYFHKIIRVCSVQQNLGMIRFWIDSGNRSCHGNSFENFQSCSFLVLQMPNSCMDLHQIFRICLPQHDMEFSRFWRDSMYNSCRGNGFNIFQSYTFLGFHSWNPYIKLPFTSNYQPIFTTTASTTDYVLQRFQVQLLPRQKLKKISIF